MYNEEKKMSTAALLLITGGIIGAVAALLYAPQSGEKTRETLNYYSRKLKKRSNETVDDLKENLTDMVNNFSTKTEEVLDKGKEIAGSSRNELIRLIEEGASQLEKFRTKLSRM